ncbi:MAG: hypothetical protein JOY61_26245, partial [Chloroflexi bacterium]|nr:hypothetical protein [Chloroflexota bacterium]
MAFEKWRLVDAQQRQRVEAALRGIDGAAERQEANCAYRLDFARGDERAIVRQFTNGTLTLQQVSGGSSGLYEELRGRIETLGATATVPGKPVG